MRFFSNLKLWCVVILAVLCSIVSGCSSAREQKALSGTVTLDGQPLANATISFRPVDESGTTSGGKTDENGRFSIPAAKGLVPGKYRVTIQVWKETDKTFKDAGTGKIVHITAPIKFKEAGNLEITVSPNGENHFNFDLHSI